MNETHEAVRAASILILQERIREHKSAADQYMVYSVYGTAVATPSDAPDEVKAVEKAVHDSCTARALFHKKEVGRFEDALASIGGETA